MAEVKWIIADASGEWGVGSDSRRVRLAPRILVMEYVQGETLQDGITGVFRAAFFAGPQDDRGGVRIAVRDLDGNGKNEVIARAAGVTSAFDPQTGTDITTAFDAILVASVF